MRGRLLYLALLTAGVITEGTGLIVALGYMEQPGPLNEALLGAIGGGMTAAGFRRWRRHHSAGLGHTRGTRQRETSATSCQ
jgi:hypothetical protein